MRYHDILALTGVFGLCCGVIIAVVWADYRWAGVVIALGSLVLLTYGASFL